MKKADIIIPHHNRHDHLKNCLDSLKNDIFNIIIVSGGSFAENCNNGAKIAKTKNLFFVNDDTLPKIDILLKMLKSKADIVGVSQKIPSHGIIHGIGFDAKTLKGMNVFNESEVFLPCGFLFKIKRKCFEELKGFDEKFVNGGEDSDIFLRAIEKKMTIDFVFEPITHFHSQSEGRLKHSRQNQIIWEKRWTKKRIKKILNLTNENFNN